MNNNSTLIFTVIRSLVFFVLTTQTVESARTEGALTAPNEPIALETDGSNTANTQLDQLLLDLKTISYDKRESPNGQRLSLIAKNLGNYNSEFFLQKNDRAASGELKRFLKSLEKIVGPISDYEYRIDRVVKYATNGHTRIEFRQILNGLEFPESSLRLNADDEAISLMLITGNPNDLFFDRSEWKSEQELLDQAIAAARNKMSDSQRELIDRLIESKHPIVRNIKGRFKIGQTGDGSLLIPIYELNYGTYIIEIEAITGVVIRNADTVQWGVTECEKKSATSSFEPFCNDDSFDIFKIDGACQNNHPACNEPKYDEAISAMVTSAFWAQENGGNVSGSFD